MNIQDKTFLISGGASGLGAATAQRLTARGANVVIADLNAEVGAATAGRLGEQAHFTATDVTSTGDVEAAAQAARDRFGALHGAICCAGVGTAEKLLGKRGLHRPESFIRTLQINLIGVFNVMRAAVAVMAEQPPLSSGERGVLINTASVAAFDGQIGQLAYAASKGGIVSMTLPAARELAPLGIRVMTIAPGIFDTPLLAGLPEPARLSLGQQVPFPARLGRPAEFAGLVAHILENEMLNGEVIRLDGAIRMAPK